jgi:D-3-phosphoglycerate dehydrogenase / 2-oxoglutarate reductase
MRETFSFSLMLSAARAPVIRSLTVMHGEGMRMLQETGALCLASALDPVTLQREIVSADALVISIAGEIDAALLYCAPRLLVVGRHGVGYDQIDVPVATERGVQVVYTPGANTESVAADTRRIPTTNATHDECDLSW